MTAPARLLAFAAVLVVVFGAGFGIGAAVGPDPVDDEAPSPPAMTTPAADHGDHGGEP